MARTRRRRRIKKRRSKKGWYLLLIAGAGFISRGYWLTPMMSIFAPNPETVPTMIPITTDRPETSANDGGPYADEDERAANPLTNVSPSDSQTTVVDLEQGAALFSSAKRAQKEGDLILARAHFSEAVETGLTPADEIDARAELRKLGQHTIFSNTVIEGDPFVSQYSIAPGDTLLQIANRYNITARLLARINGIENMHRVQAGRRIKVVRGPFHVRVTKSTHTLDVLCDNAFVDHYTVGLGAEDSTPVGKWMVKNKLINPTYYPPRGGAIITADDPENPLGERWIGLEGIDADTIGLTRYGIHGTIEPESIGKNTSMGCIRMHNVDVEVLFDLLIEGQSTVIVRE